MDTALRSDARRNRRAILEAAAATFAEQGLDAGVAEIARRAEVGPATLFRHFATKQDLVAAILDLRASQILEALDRAVATAEADPAAALEQLLLEGAQLHLRDRGLMQAAVTNEAAAERIEGIHEEFEAKVGTVLRAAQDAGVARKDLVIEDLGMAMAGVAGAALKFCDAQPGIERRVVRLLLDGMRATDAGPLPEPVPSLATVIAARDCRP
jgi:AcrR family transcriptional regulator